MPSTTMSPHIAVELPAGIRRDLAYGQVLARETGQGVIEPAKPATHYRAFQMRENSCSRASSVEFSCI